MVFETKSGGTVDTLIGRKIPLHKNGKHIWQHFGSILAAFTNKWDF